MTIAANDNAPARASNGVSVAALSFMPRRPVPAPEPKWDEDIEPDPIGQVPLEDAVRRGFFSDEQQLAIGWWVKQQTASEVSYGGGSVNVGGVHQPFVSRPPDALWGQEEAVDRRMAFFRVERLLRLDDRPQRTRGLADVLDAAIFGKATMAELAPPRLVFPKKKRPVAGRIRLGAGLDIVARFTSDDGCTMTEARDIAKAAADACMALAAVRALRPANDNAAGSGRLAA